MNWSNATFIWALLLVGCSGGGDPLLHLNSLPDQTQVPQLLRSPDGVPALAYVEAIENGHQFAYRLWQGSGWGEAIAIGTDTAMLVNWADRPQLAFGPAGSAYAHWLTLDDRGDFAYGISATRSKDGGQTWSEPSRPHGDTAVAEHGFAQWLPYDGGARLVWLDGRDFDGHPDPSQARMEVRMNDWPADSGWSAETVVDSSACTCCPMTAVHTPTGAYELIYRDRTTDEIRDFSRLHIDPVAGSSEARGPLHDDGWQIAACPVNGASLAANAERVLAVWYTAAGDGPQVLAAWRAHDDTQYGDPFALHTNAPLGRIATAADDEGRFYAVWLQTNETGGVDWVGMRWDTAGKRLTEEPEVLVAASERRAGGFPTLVGMSEGAMLGWTNPNPEPHVMTGIWSD